MTTCSLLRDSAIVLFIYSNVWDQIKIGKGHLSEIEIVPVQLQDQSGPSVFIWC